MWMAETVPVPVWPSRFGSHERLLETILDPVKGYGAKYNTATVPVSVQRGMVNVYSTVNTQVVTVEGPRVKNVVGWLHPLLAL